MTDGLLGYPEYQDSGVEWLGEIPAHWVTRRIKSLSLVKRGASPRPISNPRYFDKNGEYSWVRISDVTAATTRYLERTTQRLSELGKSYSVPLEPGSLFLSIAGSVGKPIITKIKCCIHDGFVYFPYLAGNVEFIYYVFTSGNLYSGLGKFGTQLNLNTDTVGNIVIPFPPPDEQAAIVRFLDEAERRIRRYIRAKQKLIKLLNEKKQAIIQQAVTHGLDPDVPMKDSGVEWLGEIPAHWEVLRSKYVFREINNRSITGKEAHLSMSQKHGLILSDMIEERRLVSESYINAKICETGDLVLNRLKAHLGVFALAPQQGLVSPDYTVLRPIRAIRDRYFELILRSPACRLELRQRAKGIVEGFWRLYTDDFYEIYLPIPPSEEQHIIVEVLEKELEIVDDSIDRINHEIDLLREYRTRLIADVVTGKIDVRGVAFEMPATFDESDLPDVDGDDTDDLDELDMDEAFEEGMDAE
ncbi:MAG: restriction endonuclease subunit S [Chloroflexi bacterium]|nr:restriction endonuclease subunit S [Chloroflexota bacterium]